MRTPPGVLPRRLRLRVPLGRTPRWSPVRPWGSLLGSIRFPSEWRAPATWRPPLRALATEVCRRARGQSMCQVAHILVRHWRIFVSSLGFALDLCRRSERCPPLVSGRAYDSVTTRPEGPIGRVRARAAPYDDEGLKTQDGDAANGSTSGANDLWRRLTADLSGTLPEVTRPSTFYAARPGAGSPARRRKRSLPLSTG